MRSLVVACLLVGAGALPQRPRDRDASVLRQHFTMVDDGQFEYGFETSNGIVVDAAGGNRQIGDSAGMAMHGSYSYTSPEGEEVSIDWVADDMGFRATGDHVPKAPEYVKRLLDTLPTLARPTDSGLASADPAEPVGAGVIATSDDGTPDIPPALPVADTPALSALSPVENAIDSESFSVSGPVRDIYTLVTVDESPVDAARDEAFSPISIGEAPISDPDDIFTLVTVDESSVDDPIDEEFSPVPIEAPAFDHVRDIFTHVTVDESSVDDPIDEEFSPVSIEGAPVSDPDEDTLFTILTADDSSAEEPTDDDFASVAIEDAPVSDLAEDGLTLVTVDESSVDDTVDEPVVPAQLEDPPPLEPIEDVRIDEPFASAPFGGSPLAGPLQNVRVEEAVAQAPVAEAPLADPIIDTPAPASFAQASILATAQSDPGPVPGQQISIPENIVDLANPAGGPVSGQISVASVSAVSDGTPDSIQDAIASALREDGGTGSSAPASGDIAKKTVPSSEFIVLGA